jgi:regulator of sigma E protease
MITVLLFLAVLSVLVLAHEAGHYVAARLCGVKAEEFGFGFPPRLIGFVREKGKWKRVPNRADVSYPTTIWSINWLPLGGFVRMKGEEGQPGDRDAFASKGILARLFILSAGVIMNWVVASLIFAIGFTVGVPTDLEGIPASARVQDRHVEIIQVVSGSAAAEAGIQTGDRLLQIADQPIQNAEEALTRLQTASAAAQPFAVRVQHDGAEKTVQLTPKYLEELKRPAIGVGLSTVGRVSFPWYQAVPQGVSLTSQYTKLILGAFGGLVRSIFVERQVPADVSGPVGIAVMTGKVAALGWWPLLQFAAMLSINLAVVNFLPIPALDGGRVLFVLIEAIRRRKIRPEWEGSVHRIGFILLLGLVVLVTAHDVLRYGGGIWHSLKSVVGL